MLKSESGFSLIQVMVAGAIAVSIVYLLSSSLIQVSKESARISSKADLLQLKSVLGEVLRNPATCLSNFDNKAFNLAENKEGNSEDKLNNSVSITPPLDSLWSHGEQKGSQIIAYKNIQGGKKGQGVALESIELKNWQKIKEDHYTADLELSMGNGKGPTAPVTLSFLDIRTDPKSPISAKKISYCRLIGMSAVPAPTSMIFPALSRGGGGMNTLSTEDLANATCTLAYGAGNYHCDLLQQYCSDFGDKKIAGGIYKCAVETALPQPCPSPSLECK